MSRLSEVHNARIVTRNDAREWVCPECGRTLGHVRGGKLMIRVKASWRLTFPLVVHMEQSCPKCMTISRLTAEQAATLLNSAP